MIIEKKFHFYAGHRNETLEGKCFSPHGHLYRVTLSFAVRRDPENPSVTQLFSSFDPIQEYLQEVWDHSFIINKDDPLLRNLKEFEKQNDTKIKLVVLQKTPSVENICFVLFRVIVEQFPNLIQIAVQETESSTILYNVDDFKLDAEAVIAEESMHDCMDHFTEAGLCPVCGMSLYQYRVAQRRKRRDAEQTNAGTDSEQSSRRSGNS